MNLRYFIISILPLALLPLTACEIAPPAQDQAVQRPPSVRDSATAIYAQLRSGKAQQRVQALQLLAKQPQLARKAISLILVLLGDDRQVDIAKYVGSGFYSSSVSSPAAMAAELLAKLGNWSVLPLRLRLHDHNPVVRRYAIKSLGLMAKPEHAEWLLASLGDPEAAVSKEAYAALLKQDPQVYVRLIDELNMSRRSIPQQLLLIQLLGHSQHGDALPVLFQFTQHENPILRNAAFVALAKFPDARLEKVVLQGINDSDMYVRESALLLAPQHNSREVLAGVIAQLTSQDQAVRETALEILPVMTNEKQRSIKNWQRWWQEHARVP